MDILSVLRTSLLALSPVGLGGAGWLLRLLLIERGKLHLAQQIGNIDQQAADQKLRVENTRLLLEIVERMERELARASPAAEEAVQLTHYVREACTNLKALLKNQSWDGWAAAERTAIAFLKRHDPEYAAFEAERAGELE